MFIVKKKYFVEKYKILAYDKENGNRTPCNNDVL